PRPPVVAATSAPRPPAAQSGWPHGAAPVPSAPARPAYAPTSVSPPPPPSRSRPGRVFLLILLAVLVLVCSGVISYSLRESTQAGISGPPAPRTVTSSALRLDGRDDPAGTSYRRQQLPRPGGDETTTSEGRQTR
ncbi:serine/threonine protein kinase, partial [Micromonospora sp. NPDC126480]